MPPAGGDGDEAAKANAAAKADKSKRDQELPHEVKQRLAGIFKDDPTAEAYYSADGLTFLNEGQYERLKEKSSYVRFENPNQ